MRGELDVLLRVRRQEEPIDSGRIERSKKRSVGSNIGLERGVSRFGLSGLNEVLGDGPAFLGREPGGELGVLFVDEARVIQICMGDDLFLVDWAVFCVS